MSSFTLRVIAACAFVAVLLSALAFPPARSSQPELYQVVVRTVGGGLLLAGGLALLTSLEKTLLRAGGNNAFKMFYIAAACISAVGLLQGISCIYPVNLSLAVLVFSGLSIVAGIFWLRFYHAATG